MHRLLIVVAVAHAFIASQPRVVDDDSQLRSTNNDETDDERRRSSSSPRTGGRLDAVLAEAYPERSRSEWGDFVKLGYVTVNDPPCTKKAATVKERDAIVVELPASTLSMKRRASQRTYRSTSSSRTTICWW